MEHLRILLVGNGGREHALAWKLSQSKKVEIIYVVPGNGGTAAGDLPNVKNVNDVKPNDFPGLVAFAKEHEVNLVVPGPEAPLVDGIEGFFRAGKSTDPFTPLERANPAHSWDKMLWTYQSSRSYGRLEDVCKGLHGQA